MKDSRSICSFNSLRKMAVGVLSGAAMFGFTLGASAQTPGVTPTSVKIGILGSLTGPFAIFGTGQLAGATIAIEEANAAGGINGRKIEWVSLDDESSPPKGIAGYKRLVDQEKVFAVLGPAASAVGQAMLPVLKASRTPTFISIFSTPVVTEPPMKSVFRTGPMNDRQQGIAIANYVVDELKGKRIAIIRQSDEYGKRGGDSVEAQLKKRNANIVATEVFNISDSDFSAQLGKIGAAQADVLVVYGYPNPSAIVTRQAKQLGLKATIMGANSAGSRRYPQIVGAAAAGTHNIVTLDVLPEDTTNPSAVRFNKIFAEKFPDLARQGRPDLGDVLGYGGAKVFLEALKRAGKDLTQEGLIQALEGLKDFKGDMILPTTFGPDRREGNQASRVVVIQDDLSRKVLPVMIKAD